MPEPMVVRENCTVPDKHEYLQCVESNNENFCLSIHGEGSGCFVLPKSLTGNSDFDNCVNNKTPEDCFKLTSAYHLGQPSCKNPTVRSCSELKPEKTTFSKGYFFECEGGFAIATCGTNDLYVQDNVFLFDNDKDLFPNRKCYNMPGQKPLCNYGSPAYADLSNFKLDRFAEILYVLPTSNEKMMDFALKALDSVIAGGLDMLGQSKITMDELEKMATCAPNELCGTKVTIASALLDAYRAREIALTSRKTPTAP